MPSISNAVRNSIKSKPMVFECLLEGVISHAALAEYLHPEVKIYYHPLVYSDAGPVDPGCINVHLCAILHQEKCVF